MRSLVQNRSVKLELKRAGVIQVFTPTSYSIHHAGRNYVQDGKTLETISLGDGGSFQGIKEFCGPKDVWIMSEVHTLEFQHTSYLISADSNFKTNMATDLQKARLAAKFPDITKVPEGKDLVFGGAIAATASSGASEAVTPQKVPPATSPSSDGQSIRPHATLPVDDSEEDRPSQHTRAGKQNRGPFFSFANQALSIVDVTPREHRWDSRTLKWKLWRLRIEGDSCHCLGTRNPLCVT
jgi:hypothetical protein